MPDGRWVSLVVVLSDSACPTPNPGVCARKWDSGRFLGDKTGVIAPVSVS